MPDVDGLQRSRRRLVASCALLLLACAVGEDAAPGAPIAPEELARRIAGGDAPLVLDVRTPEEYAAGHVPGARNIPHDTLAARLDELGAAPSDEIVVHCQSGRRAAAAEEALRKAGYTHVRDLSGHWQAWERAGLPAE